MQLEKQQVIIANVIVEHLTNMRVDLLVFAIIWPLTGFINSHDKFTFNFEQSL